MDATSGPLGNGGQSLGVAWGDYDGDGDLDLYLANYDQSGKLFRNEGAGAFVDATSGPLVDAGSGQGGVWGDFDNDGDLDLYLVKWGQANKLFRNDGGGSFVDATSGPLGDTGQGAGAAWGDYDRDGDIDLYLANWAQANKLFRNDGAGGFVNATNGPLGNTGNGVGVAWGDYDNDGDPDIYLANAGQANKLFRNDGGAGFVDATSGPLGDTGQGQGVAWGDYDQDGDLDLYLANNGQSNKLFRNDGGGVFVDATSGPLGDAGPGTGVAWADYDNDGDLDLYLANYGVANKLFRNDGGGVFADATSGPLGDTDNGRGVAWGDYDQDGDLDLYLANYNGVNKLFRNDVSNGNHWIQVNLAGTASNRSGIGARVRVVVGGLQQIQEVSGGSGYLSQNSLMVEFGLGASATVDTLEIRWPSGIVQKLTGVATNQILQVQEAEFTDVTAGPLGDTGLGEGVAWGDYDQDGDLDLYLANYEAANKLFRNDGGSGFVNATSGPLGDTSDGFGVAWGDYDNDGDLDLYLAINLGASKLFRNDGGGGFVDATRGPLGNAGPGQGVAWGDYDNDGDLDLYLASLGANKLFRNENGTGNHWLHVNLVGTASNRSGIGARVRAVAGSLRQIQEVSGSSGYLSQNSLTVEFGLGAATTIDSLIVRWPSGILQVVAPAPGVNSIVTVTETDGSFVDRTNGPLGDPSNGRGVAWGDYDGDGDEDLYLANDGSANKLFRNEGGGTFVDATSGPLGDTGSSQGATWGDYDDDGDLDLYLVNNGSANKLFRNEGSGTFVDATSGPLGGTGGGGATWVDYEKDGDLDLYVGSGGSGSKLYRNEGGGTFVNATSGPLGDTGGAPHPAWGDYDNDGDPDLYLSVEFFGTSKLLRNEGGGNFVNVTAAPLGLQGYGVAWGDYDNDGDLDLYQARVGLANKLYRNEGSGTFADVTSGPLGDLGQGFNVAWADYDNDGDLDLYLTNYGAGANQVGGNKLFRNEGSPGYAFVNITSGPLWLRTGSTGSAWGDVDNDGDLDLYLANIAFYIDSDPANKLYRNEIGTANHWLHVKLTGTVSNRSAIGARVRAVAGSLVQIQEVNGGSGYFSQNSLPVEFGLGAATTVDTLEVRWPSGQVQKFTGVAVDQVISVQEVVFKDVTSGPLAGPGNGTGVAWGDYDQDGDLDLYSSHAGTSKLYRNEGSGSFTDVTVAPLDNTGNSGQGAAWGDYDNDGDLDLYLANNGQANKLFRNEGAGAFVDATSGPLGDVGAGNGVAWADYDRDGDLDLFLARNGVDKLFRNEGATGFVTVALPGVGGGTSGVSWGDVDGDGDPDLALANNPGASRIFRNDGGSAFSNITPAFLTVVLGGRGVAWGDYDNDGDLDLYLSREGGANKLVRNDGHGAFSDATVGSLGDTGLGEGVAWGDYDQDGDLDLYLVNSNSPNRLLRNDGNGTFADAANSALAAVGPGQGVAWGDYDQDGDLDLYLANNAAGANRLLRNDNVTGNHWLQVNLRGSTSNRMGVGALVRAVSGSLVQVREVSGGSGFLSQDSPAVEFGLGARTTVDTLEVRWPSGIRQRLTNVAADQVLSVLESQWTDVAVGAAADTDPGAGCAWGDFDGDGDLDLYIAVNGANKLLRNDGGNTFADVATPTIRSAAGVGRGAVWGDYDNDGDLDLYLANLSGDTNRLFRNDGGGAFADASSGPLGSSGQTLSGVWGDYDRDGDIDLYLVHPDGPNQLLRNDGAGVFANVTTGALGNGTDSRGAMWVDVDNDGDLDLYVSNQLAPNQLLRNDGIGGFNNVAIGALANNAQGRATPWGDYDNDGDLDVFLPVDFGPDKLLRNDGGFNFADVTPTLLANPDRGSDGEWADYDNDGDLDLYVTNLNTAGQYLYRNEGGGVFVDATSGEVGDDAGAGNSPGGLAWGDSDGDGDLDLYVTWVGRANRLFRNETTGKHWLQVDLRGTVSNRAAIGARVRARTGAISQIREVSGGGRRSQESLTVEFGFGLATVVDTLEVRWPSGQRTTLTALPVDRKMTVTEPPAPPSDGTFPLSVWGAPSDQEGIGGLLGYAVDGAGDVNGDGFKDVLVGSSQGKVLLFLGGPTSDEVPDLILRSETPGAYPYENYGVTLAGVGDVNGDGFDDWLVGAKSHNGAGTQSGRAYLYLGDSALNGTADVVMDGVAANDLLGVSVAGVGDLNHDGYDDWAVGASGNDGGGLDAGRVYVYLGGATPDGNPDLAFNGLTGEGFGNKLSGGGDLNRDGYDDVVVCAPNSNVRVFLGGPAVNSISDLVVPIQGGTQFRSVSVLGDLNGDGYDEFSIDAAISAESSIRTSVYLGGPVLNGTPDLLLTTPGNSAVSSSLGDLNGDGFDDLAVGDQEASSGGRRGAVSVFYGRQILSTTPDLILRGETTASAFGLSLASCGDVDGDKVDDAVVGDPSLMPSNGRAYVFSGRGGWTDATSGPLGNTGPGIGVAWGDYDQDGDQDIYLSNHGQANKLFRNDGGGVFSDATSGPLGDTGDGTGAAWGDYDNDGDLDLYLANDGQANKLFRNEGGGVFADATSGPLGVNGGFGEAWGDYDRDGDLDLYLAKWGQGNMLLRNDGGSVFVDATSGPLGDAGFTMCATWEDYDNDGDLDLYLAKWGQANKLLRNDGGGVFLDATSGPLGDTGNGSGAAWGDYDQDGDLDLYLSNNGQANKLIRNDGGGAFVDATSGPLGGTSSNGGASWGDYDQDGDLDLYLVSYGQGNQLFRNDGGGAFADATSGPLGDTGLGESAAWADYDQDGDLDLYQANRDQANKLFRNDQETGNHWLHVNLVGTVSNRSGIGARVRVVAGGKSQIQEISGGSGFASQNSLTAEFGLGTASTVDTLEVRWPSGIVTRRTAGLVVDQVLQVTEVEFADATSGPLGDTGQGYGVAWGDYDQDGDPDLFLANLDLANKLFRNDGAGNFVNVTSGAMATASAGQGAVWGDYDNDGDPDLYLVCSGANKLFRNDGGSVFVDATSGPLGDTGYGQGVAWSDFDRDGDLDLYLANFDTPNKLFRNEGGGTFANATAGPLAGHGNGEGVAWGDYDNDGDPDLYLANYGLANQLFRNDGSGIFADVTNGPLGNTGNSLGVAWGDYDGDADLDLYVVNHGQANKLFRNDGGGTFADVTSDPLGDTGQGRGVDWGDYDLDGDLDLYLTNDGANKLFRNEGGGVFVDATRTPLGDAGVGTGAAWADYDLDGDLDLYVANHGTANRLFRNDINGTNRWLEVDLTGSSSNRSAIGARLRVVAGGRQQIRDISGGSGYFSQPSLTAEFGLGNFAYVDTLEIRWPSGTNQVLVGVAANRRLTLVEPSGGPDVTAVSRTAAPNTATASVNILGSKLDASGLSVSLTGPATIPAASVTAVSGVSVTASFNLTGAPVGSYNLSLTSSGGSDVLSNALIVHAGGVTLHRSTSSTAADTDPAYPRTPGLQDTVIFVSARGTGTDLYIKDPSSLDTAPLTALTTLGNVAGPSFSPNARKVVFENAGSLYLLDLVTPGVPALLTTGTRPQWSPVGDHIAFVKSLSGGRSGIFSISAGGTGLTQLTDPPGSGRDSNPTWSPDGDHIAFTRDATGAGSEGVFIVPGVGGESADRHEIIPASGLLNRDLSWSPDGRWLAVASNRSGTFDIYLADSRGQSFGLLQITQGASQDTKPSWNADGTGLAFVSDYAGNEDVYVLSGLTALSDGDGDLVPNSLDACVASAPPLGQVDRDFNGCGDLPSSFRFSRFWNADQLPVMYQVTSTGDPRITDGSEFTEIQAAFDTWRTVTGVALSGGDDGTHAGLRDVVAGDGKNSITFGDVDAYLPLTLAITLSTVAESDTVINGRWYRPGEIVDSDILFNANDFRFATPSAPSAAKAYDLRAVATHEFGHFFGLAHSTVVSTTMYPVVPLNTAPWSLEKDDVAQIRRGYASAPALSLEGRVLRGDGSTPVTGAVVMAIADAAPMDTLQQTLTGVDGTYRFYDLDRSFRVRVTPLDGSASVNGVTASAVNADLTPVVETDFFAEYWDEASETNNDAGAPGFVVVRPGPTVNGANILLNVDLTPPQIVSTTPANGELNASVNGAITIEFNEELSFATVGSNLSLRNVDTGTGVGGVAAGLKGNMAIGFTSTAPLAFASNYRLTVRTGITDLSGNPLADSLVVNFRTESQPGVALTSITPSSAAAGGAIVIYGAGFDPDPTHNLIAFNGVSIQPTAATLDRLNAVVPPGAATGNLSVTVGTTPSNALPFTVLPHRLPPKGNLLAGYSLPGPRPRKIDIGPRGDFVYVATDMGVTALSARAASFADTVDTISLPGGCTGVAAMPDGKHVLATSAMTPQLRVIDSDPLSATFNELLPPGVDLGAGIPLGISVVPGGAEVVVSYAGKLVLIATPSDISDPQFGKPIREWSYPGGPFLGPVSVSRNGDVIIAATGDNHFATFDRTAGGGPTGTVRSGVSPREAAPLPDGQRVFGVDLSGTATEFENLGFVRTSLAGGGGYSAITASPEGDFAYAADLILNRIDVIDLTLASPRKISSFATGIDPLDVLVSPNGEYIYAVTEVDRKIELYSTVDGPFIETVSPSSGGTGTVFTLVGSGFNPTAASNLVSMGGEVLTPLAVDAAGTILTVKQTSGVTEGPVAVTTGGKTSNTVEYRVVNRSGPGNFALAPGFSGGASDVRSMVRSPDGKLLVTRTADGTLFLLGEEADRPKFHRVIASMAPGTSGLTGGGPMVFTPAGGKLYAGDRGTSRVRVFAVDPESPAPILPLGTIQNGSGPAIVDPVSMAMTPDGKRLLVASAGDNTVYEISTDTDAVSADIRGSFTAPTAVAVHPRGKLAYVLQNDTSGGIRVGVYDIDPGSGNYRSRVATVSLTGSPTAMVQLLMAPGGDRAVALVGSSGSTYRLKLINTDPLSGGAYHTETGSLLVGTGAGVPAATLNQSGTLCFVADPNGTTLKSVNLATFSLGAGSITNGGLTSVRALSVSIEDARLYAASGSSVLMTDLTDAAGLSFVSGTSQVGVENQPLSFPIVVRASPAAEGAPVVFEAVGTGSFAGGDALGYTVSDATGAAMASFIPGGGGGSRILRAKLSGITIETTVTVLGDTTLVPPQIVATSPPPNQVLGVITTVGAEFSKGIHPASVSTTTFLVKKLASPTPLPGTYHFASRERRVVFFPDAALDYGATYTFELTSGLQDYNGNPLSNPGIFTFQTAAAPTGVTLAAISPRSATVGDPVVISGEGFEPDPAGNTVTFGSVAARVEGADAQALVTRVPGEAVSGPIHVTARGQASNALDFEVIVPAPRPVTDLSAEISVPTSGNRIVVTPDALRAYMTSPEGNTTVPILLGSLASEAPVPVGIYPVGVAISPAGDRVYVANFLSNDVSVIDTRVGSETFHRVVGTISIGNGPLGVASNPNGREIYVITSGDQGNVVVVDTDPNSNTYTAKTNIQTASTSQSVTVTPDGGRLIIGTRDGLLIIDIEGEDYGAKTNIQTASTSQSVTVTPDGGFVLVLSSTGTLTLIDIRPGPSFGAAKTNIQTASTSQSVTVSPDGSTVYVSTSDGRILIYSFALVGSEAAVTERSNTGFAFVPIDTVFVGENLAGMAFSGRDRLVVVDSGARKVRLVGGGVTPIPCGGSVTADGGVLTDNAVRDTLALSLPAGAIQLQASLTWTPPSGGHDLDLRLFRQTGSNPTTGTLVRLGTGSPGSLKSLLVQGLTPGTYFFEMQRTSPVGTQIDWNLAVSTCVETVVGVPDEGPPVTEPPAYRLLQNVPNPFRAGAPTRIRFTLAEPGNVRLLVFDLRGALVRTLVKGWQDRGSHTATWDGTTDQGAQAAAGVYFYRMEVEKRFVEGRRLLLLR